jgi:hypothetical protein
MTPYLSQFDKLSLILLLKVKWISFCIYITTKTKSMKQKISIIALGFLLTVGVVTSNAATPGNDRPNKDRVETMTDAQKVARVEEIRTRVNEIKGMDKSGLSRSERKAVRKELRDMKKESREMKGGVYLSIGAIIIIILLLILIL